jgi:hypothetical protein
MFLCTGLGLGRVHVCVRVVVYVCVGAVGAPSSPPIVISCVGSRCASPFTSPPITVFPCTFPPHTTRNTVDFTYVGNVVHAHLLAAEKLCAPGTATPACNGKVGLGSCGLPSPALPCPFPRLSVCQRVRVL